MLAPQLRRFGVEAQRVAAVADQIGQGRHHAFKVEPGQRAIDSGIGAEAEEHGVEVVQQLIEAEVAADLDAQPELDAHALQHLPARAHHFLVELERWDAETQQAADLGMAIEHHRINALTRQHIGTGEARGPGTDHRDALAGLDHARQIRPPALGQGGVGDVFLDAADGDCAEVVVERAGAFAEAILWADPTADLGQRIGRMRQLGGLEQPTLADQLQPVRDVVMNWTLPLAVGVAAVQAACGLVGRIRRLVLAIDLAAVEDAQLDRHLGRHAPVGAQEMHRVAFHQAALRSALISESRPAAFGLTSQKRGRKPRKSSRISAARVLPVSTRWRSIRLRRCCR